MSDSSAAPSLSKDKELKTDPLTGGSEDVESAEPEKPR